MGVAGVVLHVTAQITTNVNKLRPSPARFRRPPNEPYHAHLWFVSLRAISE